MSGADESLQARFRGTDVELLETLGSQERLASRLDDRSGLVPRHSAALLSHCDRFRTLDEHAEVIRLAAGLAPERQGALRTRLAALAHSGWLTQESELASRCRAQRGAPPRPVALLGVPTCDRVVLLERALRSYMRNSREHGRNVTFVVADDSRGADSSEGNRASLSKLKREFGVRVAWGGWRDRETYAAGLARESGVHGDVTAFALLGAGREQVSTGAARNALLLHAMGEPFVHVDDDTVCRVAAAPGKQRGLALTAVHTDMEQSFFATRGEALASVHFEPVDYFGLFERVLGRSVADLLTELPAADPLDLDGLRPQLARRLGAAPCHVAAASLGVVGDSGLGSTEMYLFSAHPTSRARLLAYPGGHRRAFESQQLCRATRRTTLAESGLCLGIALGLDASVLLPPFFPALRNSDGIFARVRQSCLPGALMAFLPWVVEHAPPSERLCSMEQVLARAGRVCLSDFVSWFVRGHEDSCGGDVPERRLDALGRQLVEIGSLSRSDYEARCRSVLERRVAGMAQYVEVFEQHAGDATSAWREDLLTYLSRARLVVASPDGIVPLDLARAGAEPWDAIARGQRLVREYGELLRAWPAMIRAALTLKARGNHPIPDLS